MKTSSLTTSAFRSLIKSLFVLAAVLPLAVGCTGSSVKPATGPEAQPAADWELVFSDEFNAPGSPDGNKWRYEVGYRRNNEMQYYTKARRENARLENGVLVIEARNDDWQGHAVTSASLTTRGTLASAMAKSKCGPKSQPAVARGLRSGPWAPTLLRLGGQTAARSTS
ncbi:MAG: hypothetical protein WA970_18335, partial [Gammaproteobacteria bacterium]